MLSDAFNSEPYRGMLDKFLSGLTIGERKAVDFINALWQAKITKGELITKEEHERLIEEVYEQGRDNPPMLVDPNSGR